MRNFGTFKGKTIEKAIFWANHGLEKAGLEIVRPSAQMRETYNGKMDNELWLVDTVNDSPKKYLTFSEIESGVFEVNYK